MQPLRLEGARNAAFKRIRALKRVPATETVPLDEAAGRILAETAFADRDYPPINPSARAVIAVIAADVAEVPATLELIGETRAGEPSSLTLWQGWELPARGCRDMSRGKCAATTAWQRRC